MRLATLVAAASVASAQWPTQGLWEHIQPNANAQGNNPYPGCPSGPNADPSCIGPISLWHQGGELNIAGITRGVAPVESAPGLHIDSSFCRSCETQRRGMAAASTSAARTQPAPRTFGGLTLQSWYERHGIAYTMRFIFSVDPYPTDLAPLQQRACWILGRRPCLIWRVHFGCGRRQHVIRGGTRCARHDPRHCGCDVGHGSGDGRAVPAHGPPPHRIRRLPLHDGRPRLHPRPIGCASWGVAVGERILIPKAPRAAPFTPPLALLAGWVWSQHMWAINIDAATAAISSNQPQSWVRLQNQTAGAWAGRAGFTLARYGGDILMYGGYK